MCAIDTWWTQKIQSWTQLSLLKYTSKHTRSAHTINVSRKPSTASEQTGAWEYHRMSNDAIGGREASRSRASRPAGLNWKSWEGTQVIVTRKEYCKGTASLREAWTVWFPQSPKWPREALQSPVLCPGQQLPGQSNWTKKEQLVLSLERWGLELHQQVTTVRILAK